MFKFKIKRHRRISSGPYGSGSLMALNMMEIYASRRRARLSAGFIVMAALPLLAVCLFALSMALPDLQFFAECQNVPGGDVCGIRLG